MAFRPSESDKYASAHASKHGPPTSAYNSKPEPGVWDRIKGYGEELKKAIGWKEYNTPGPVGGSAGMARSVKAGMNK